jgi:hypothetical protein
MLLTNEEQKELPNQNRNMQHQIRMEIHLMTLLEPKYDSVTVSVQ